MGSSGHPGHRKMQFWVHFGGPLGWFWLLFGVVLGCSLVNPFVCMRLCGFRVCNIVSYAMSHGLALDFSTLRYNITSQSDVMLRHFASSYLGLHYNVSALVCVVIDGVCSEMSWYALLITHHAIVFSKWYELKL